MRKHTCTGCLFLKLFYNLEMKYFNRTMKAAEDYRMETTAAEARFQSAMQMATTGVERARATEERKSSVYQAFRALRTEREEADLELLTKTC